MKEKTSEEEQKTGAESALGIEDKEKLLRMSEISIWLDTYDDIFSDFDPRPYPERSMSDDFVYEAKKASRGKPSGKIELKLLVPANKRNHDEERLIKKRIKEHFKTHFTLARKEAKDMIKNGLFFAVAGVILMVIISYVLFKNPYPERSFLVSFLIILLEPSSWFLFWEGLRLVVFESKNKKPELEFYEKMSNCEIEFLSY